MNNDSDMIVLALGGREALAGQLNITEYAILKWRQNGIPTKHWSDIVQLSKGAISWKMLDEMSKARAA